MLVDAHHHFWDPAETDMEWIDRAGPLHRRFGLREFEDAIERLEPDYSILVQTRPSVDETVQFLEVACSDNLVAGVVGWLDLHRPIPPQLERIDTVTDVTRLVGVRHQAQDEADDEWLASTQVGQAVVALAEHNITYDILIRAHQLPAAVALARAAPNTRMVLNHCAKPDLANLADWKTSIRDLAELPNVACKLSGLVTEADWACWTPADFMAVVDTLFGTFGPERLLFGSDWPVCLLAASYDEVHALALSLTAELTVGERDQIFGINALKWYGFSDRHADEPIPTRSTPAVRCANAVDGAV